MNASKRINELLTVKMGKACFVETVFLFPVYICTVKFKRNVTYGRKFFQLKDQVRSIISMLTNDNVANAFKIHLISF